jgi:hypothetical protein
MTVEEALEKVRKNGRELKHLPIELKTAEVCLEAVKEGGFGFALDFVPENLKTSELWALPH